MITCPNCQFENPGVHKFCQQCGEPLPAEDDLLDKLDEGGGLDEDASPEVQRLQAHLMPPNKRQLAPATALDAAQRYQVVTVLSQGSALVADQTPEVRSPLQSQLAQLLEDSSAPPQLSALQAIDDLPAAAYPYLLLAEAAPALYDVFQQDDITLLISPERAAISPLLTSISAAVDPLQYVYWIYTLTELWAALEPISQWRSSLIQADNLGIDADQSLRIRRFIAPSIQPPKLADLKGFLQSLLAQPHRGTNPLLRQIRKIILAVSSAQTLEDLSRELADIGQGLLDVPAAMTPSVLPGALPKTLPDVSAAVETSGANDPLDNPLDSANEMDVMDTEDDLTKALPTDDESGETDDATMLLPMRLSGLIEAGTTHVGKQRDHNEDCFLITSFLYKRSDNGGQYARAHGLYVLCDGMGGHAGGEVASSLAAQTLSAYFDEHWPAPSPLQPNPPLPEESVVVEAVKLANQAIYDVNEKEERAGHERMGTTLVLVLLQGMEAVVAHVGDSRLYQLNRRMGLRQVTTDHEVGQREMQRGIPAAVAYARPDAYQLTQALGPRDSEHLQPSVSYLRFVEDTLLLLCSDGLSDNDLVEDYWESHINPLLKGEKTLTSGLGELVDLANEVNGHDNISAIALQIKVTPDLSEMNKPKIAEQTILQ
ncbi:MAG: serine/threonine phosphatase [Phormidesmis sp.]